MQYAENRVTRHSMKEAFRATGASPLPFIPEGRTDSPPEGRWSPLTGPCALREPPSKPASCFRGYRPSMQALIGLSQPLGLTSWSISLSAECDWLCCHLSKCHPTLRLAVLPPAAHPRHNATCHRQLAGTTGLDDDEGGERRWQSTICKRKL